MTSEKDAALVRDFPHLYRHRFADPRDTCMCWGFECGDGWEPLIRRLSEKLEPAGIVATQVKEKFGTLRFYIEGASGEASVGLRLLRIVKQILRLGRWHWSGVKWWDPRDVWRRSEGPPAYDWIDEAEMESARTCERCGGRGKLRTDRSWRLTLCDFCAEVDGGQW